VLLTAGKSPAVAASVVYHGSRILPADVEAINAPINFQQSDPALDRQLPTELYNQVRGAVVQQISHGTWTVSLCCNVLVQCDAEQSLLCHSHSFKLVEPATPHSMSVMPA
jgi:dienelactone hydrolase